MLSVFYLYMPAIVRSPSDCRYKAKLRELDHKLESELSISLEETAPDKTTMEDGGAARRILTEEV